MFVLCSLFFGMLRYGTELSILWDENNQGRVRNLCHSSLSMFALILENVHLNMFVL